MEFMESWMNAEIESRERSKRSRLPQARRIPADKELGGYDWTPIRFPVDYGRGQITTLDFIAGPRRPRPVRPSWHWQDPPRHRARQERMPQGHTRIATSPPQAWSCGPSGPTDKLASTGNSLRSAGPPLLVIDELGYVPIDEDGSRLLFQVVTNAYETQSIIYPPTSSSADGQDLRRL